MVQTRLENKPKVNATVAPNSSFSGESNGTSAGLGFTFPSNGDLSYFVYGLFSRQSGEFAIAYENLPVRYSDFKVSQKALFAAIQYRVIGDADSFFAMGIFGGPGFYSYETAVTYNEEGSARPPSQITFNPSGLGALAGFQLLFRPGPFRINPYAIAFTGVGGTCQELESTPDSQEDGPRRSRITLRRPRTCCRYKSFRITVFTHLPSQEALPITVTSYSLSLAIGF